MSKKKMNPLDEVFGVLFPDFSHYPISDSRKADMVIRDFNVQKIGEEKAFCVCCEIILRTNFLDRTQRKKIIGHAEHFLPEILGTNPDHEFHMDEVADLEERYLSSSFEEIKILYR